MSTYNTDIIQKIMDDPKFSLWVTSGFEAEAHYWQQWQYNNPNDTEALQEAIVLFQSFEAPVTSPRPELWSKINNTIKQQAPTSKVIQLNWLQTLSAIAAVAVLILGVYSVFFSDIRIAATDSFVHHTLPDGSRVTLNKDSEISYSRRHFMSERSIELEGEAFFEVEKGSQFSVLSSSGKVQVLGTSFNIYDRGEQYEVKCHSGRVAVLHQNNVEPVLLSPGEKVIMHHDKNEKINIDNHEPLWTSGSFYYHNQDLNFVLEELARQFQLELDIQKLTQNRKYNGYFETKNVKNAVYSVCWPMNLDCKIVGKKLVIIEK